MRQKEFDEVMPDEKLLVSLFCDDGKLIWPRLEPQLKAMRARLEKAGSADQTATFRKSRCLIFVKIKIPSDMRRP